MNFLEALASAQKDPDCLAIYPTTFHSSTTAYLIRGGKLRALNRLSGTLSDITPDVNALVGEWEVAAMAIINATDIPYERVIAHLANTIQLEQHHLQRAEVDMYFGIDYKDVLEPLSFQPKYSYRPKVSWTINRNYLEVDNLYSLRLCRSSRGRPVYCRGRLSAAIAHDPHKGYEPTVFVFDTHYNPRLQ